MTAPDSTPPLAESPAPSTPWRLGPLLLVAAFVGLLLFWQSRTAGPPRDPLAAVSRAASTNATVSLAIDRGDGALWEFAPLAWYPEMTVAEALSAAVRQQPEKFRFHAHGTGPHAFVDEMAGIKNAAGGAEASYWLLFVNDEAARQSFAITPVAAGDRILWKYAKLE